MSLWGKSVSAESRPKGFPDDSNSKYARENIYATNKGWVVRGTATGNDNADDEEDEDYGAGPGTDEDRRQVGRWRLRWPRLSRRRHGAAPGAGARARATR